VDIPDLEAIDHDDVKRFAAVAEELCGVVEKVSRLKKAYFLERMDELLPLIYSLAPRLPYPFDPDPDEPVIGDEDYDPMKPHPRPIAMTSPESTQLQRTQRDRIGRKLGLHRSFHFVYDPVDPADKEIINADLADILSDIYVGLKEGLILYGRSSDIERAYAVSDWRLGVECNWGRDVAEAFLPIHSLIHWHYDEDDEVFRP